MRYKSIPKSSGMFSRNHQNCTLKNYQQKPENDLQVALSLPGSIAVVDWKGKGDGCLQVTTDYTRLFKVINFLLSDILVCAWTRDHHIRILVRLNRSTTSQDHFFCSWLPTSHQNIPSPKLTWPLKMDGWKMNFLLGRPGLFPRAILVLGRAYYP